MPRALKSAAASLILAIAGCDSLPEQTTTAIIVNIAPAHTGRWGTGNVQITARSASGLVGVKVISINRLTCRVGDYVRATARGLSLTLATNACVE